jgi:hypothetical protein
VSGAPFAFEVLSPDRIVEVARLRCPGSGRGDLIVEALDGSTAAACGDIPIEDGISVRFEDSDCGFVISKADLRALLGLVGA